MEICIKARAGARAVNAARFGFAEVDEELGEQLVRATHEAARPDEELLVGELLPGKLESASATNSVKANRTSESTHEASNSG
jgi:hypothetical protein